MFEEAVSNVEKRLELQTKRNTVDLTMCWENRRKSWKTVGIPTKYNICDIAMCWEDRRQCWKTIGIPIKTEHICFNYVLK